MATHSSIPDWRIPWREKPGGIQSVGSQRVEQDWSDSAHTHAWYSFRDQGHLPSSLVIGRIQFLTFNHWMRSSFPWHMILNSQANNTASNPSHCSQSLNSSTFHFSLEGFMWSYGGGSLTTNKASGGDGIPVELFQILKDDAVKAMHSICQQIWKTQQWPQDWKRSFSFQSQRKAVPKNVLTTTNCTHLTC